MAEVDIDELRLAPLRAGHELEALAACAELDAEGFPFLLGMETATSWDDHLARMAANRCGERLPEGHVPSTFLGAFIRGALVGRTSIRHELTPFLEREGGHIGYAVRPSHRRRGIATAILRQSLVVARAAGVDDVLLTCDDDNVASATVIERCGGVLGDVVQSDAGGPPLRRYWIR